MTDLIQVGGSGGFLALDLAEAAYAFAQQAKASGTRRVYASAWREFCRWCEAHGRQPLPATPETVALFVTARAQAGKRVATIERELASISEAHRTAGFESPRSAAGVRLVMQGIRRSLGIAAKGKAALTVPDLRAAIEALPPGIGSLRDRALLTIGFCGAFRRSELVGLNVEDFAFVAEGLEITLRRSKTDQDAAGRKVGIPFGGNALTCPVKAVRAWLDAANFKTGPVFRSVNRYGQVAPGRLSDKAVALIVKRTVAAIGLDAARFSGHSLRVGFCTAAAKAGKATHQIQAQTGHRSLVVLHRYIREATLFDDNAAHGIGL